MHCVEFCQFSVFVFYWCGVLYSGNRISFLFWSRQEDEGKRNRGAQSNPPGRCFPTVVFFFVYIHVVWFVIELLNVDVL